MLLLKSNGLDHHLLSFHSTIPFRILLLLLICTHLSILEEIYNLDKSLANPSSHELKILNFYEHTYEQAHEKLNPSWIKYKRQKIATRPNEHPLQNSLLPFTRGGGGKKRDRNDRRRVVTGLLIDVQLYRPAQGGLVSPNSPLCRRQIFGANALWVTARWRAVTSTWTIDVSHQLQFARVRGGVGRTG